MTSNSDATKVKTDTTLSERVAERRQTPVQIPADQVVKSDDADHYETHAQFEQEKIDRTNSWRFA